MSNKRGVRRPMQLSIATASAPGPSNMDDEDDDSDDNAVAAAAPKKVGFKVPKSISLRIDVPVRGNPFLENVPTGARTAPASRGSDNISSYNDHVATAPDIIRLDTSKLRSSMIPDASPLVQSQMETYHRYLPPFYRNNCTSPKIMAPELSIHNYKDLRNLNLALYKQLRDLDKDETHPLFFLRSEYRKEKSSQDGTGDDSEDELTEHCALDKFMFSESEDESYEVKESTAASAPNSTKKRQSKLERKRNRVRQSKKHFRRLGYLPMVDPRCEHRSKKNIVVTTCSNCNHDPNLTVSTLTFTYGKHIFGFLKSTVFSSNANDDNIVVDTATNNTAAAAAITEAMCSSDRVETTFVSKYLRICRTFGVFLLIYSLVTVFATMERLYFPLITFGLWRKWPNTNEFTDSQLAVIISGRAMLIGFIFLCLSMCKVLIDWIVRQWNRILPNIAISKSVIFEMQILNVCLGVTLPLFIHILSIFGPTYSDGYSVTTLTSAASIIAKSLQTNKSSPRNAVFDPLNKKIYLTIHDWIAVSLAIISIIAMLPTLVSAAMNWPTFASSLRNSKLRYLPILWFLLLFYCVYTNVNYARIHIFVSVAIVIWSADYLIFLKKKYAKAIDVNVVPIDETFKIVYFHPNNPLIIAQNNPPSPDPLVHYLADSKYSLTQASLLFQKEFDSTDIGTLMRIESTSHHTNDSRIDWNYEFVEQILDSRITPLIRGPYSSIYDRIANDSNDSIYLISSDEGICVPIQYLIYLNRKGVRRIPKAKRVHLLFLTCSISLFRYVCAALQLLFAEIENLTVEVRLSPIDISRDALYPTLIVDDIDPSNHGNTHPTAKATHLRPNPHLHTRANTDTAESATVDASSNVVTISAPSSILKSSMESLLCIPTIIDDYISNDSPPSVYYCGVPLCYKILRRFCYSSDIPFYAEHIFS